MGDRSVVGMSGPRWYWRGLVPEVLAQKAAAVFIDGVLGHGAVSPIEYAWMRGLSNRGSEAAKYKSSSGLPHSEHMESGPGQEIVGRTHREGCGGSYRTDSPTNKELPCGPVKTSLKYYWLQFEERVSLQGSRGTENRASPLFTADTGALTPPLSAHWLSTLAPFEPRSHSGQDSGQAWGGLAGLLGQQDGLDVGQHASLSDGHTAQQLVQLLVVADGQLQVTRDDAALLVVSGGVTGQLQDLGGEILQDGGQVHGRSGPDSVCVVTLAEVAVDAAYGELQSGAGAAGLGLSAGLGSSFSSSRHFRRDWMVVTVVTMVPSGMTVRSTSTFLAGCFCKKGRKSNAMQQAYVGSLDQHRSHMSRAYNRLCLLRLAGASKTARSPDSSLQRTEGIACSFRALTQVLCQCSLKDLKENREVNKPLTPASGMGPPSRPKRSFSRNPHTLSARLWWSCVRGSGCRAGPLPSCLAIFLDLQRRSTVSKY
ncbi:hypothetical protein EYF80_017290 [Liparis tanakae]|uniref:Uncharacterized protein n=1 Tax=Liparis tanakae TaxID=230148 RepID=A0A4Z2I5D9_9TELE|nr:hypothetical protein EYF80_017290 [Liparis tanakae]